MIAIQLLAGAASALGFQLPISREREALLEKAPKRVRLSRMYDTPEEDQTLRRRGPLVPGAHKSRSRKWGIGRG